MIIDHQTSRAWADHGDAWTSFVLGMGAAGSRVATAIRPALPAIAALLASSLAIGASVLPGVVA